MTPQGAHAPELRLQDAAGEEPAVGPSHARGSYLLSQLRLDAGRPRDAGEHALDRWLGRRLEQCKRAV